MTAEGPQIQAAVDHLPSLETPRGIEMISTWVVNSTELAAIEAARTAGKGDKKASDKAAVDVMRSYLDTLPIRGEIVIGEGEKDKAPMLFNNEQLGSGGPKIEIAVDPLEGTDATGDKLDGASSVLAISGEGGFYKFFPSVHYTDKLIVGPEAAGKVDIDAPPEDNLAVIANALGRNISKLTIVILKRDRNEELIRRVRKAGAIVKAIPYGDLMPGVFAGIRGTAVHAVMGIGGAPEGVLTAAALKPLGGEIQVRPWAESPEKEAIFESQGVDTKRVYTTQDLVPGKSVIFSATAVTDHGDVLPGVRFFDGGARTSSLVICSRDNQLTVEIRDFTRVQRGTEFHL